MMTTKKPGMSKSERRREQAKEEIAAIRKNLAAAEAKEKAVASELKEGRDSLFSGDVKTSDSVAQDFAKRMNRKK